MKTSTLIILNLVLLVVMVLLPFCTRASASETQKVDILGLKPLEYNKALRVAPRDRTLFLKDDIEAAKMQELGRQLREMARKSTRSIYLVIDSPGGSIMAGNEFIREMQGVRATIGTPTICVVVGRGYSMAAVIAQYCYSTYIVPLGTMLFHQASYGVSGEQDRVTLRVDFMQKFLREFEGQLAHQMGLGHDEFVKFRDGERWLVSSEAVRFGVVDAIVPEFYFDVEPPKEDMWTIFFRNLGLTGMSPFDITEVQ